MKKLFGGINLTWPKLIIAAVAAGVFTAVMALIPALLRTSFIAITVTFEIWILFGILIIMNSKSNLDSALKCFVFFLISQPLVYLIQVPFSEMGWGLFSYYRFWFICTLLCFPMGFVGYFMKKDKWWGYLILLPMIVLTGYSLLGYFSDFQFSAPRYILIVLFCAAAMILYPVFIFRNKIIRIVGAAVGTVGVIAIIIICLFNPPVYSIDLFNVGDDKGLSPSYNVTLEDSSYGDAEIRYIDDLESYAVHIDFKKAGHTKLILKTPDGVKKEYAIDVERNTYNITEST